MKRPRPYVPTPPSAPAPPAASAPTYYECGSCGFLSDDPRMADAERHCPKCRSEGVRRTFPSERLRRLDARIRRYQHEGEHEVVVILVAAFLEAILEDALDRLLGAHGADVAVRQVVLDGQRAIGGRIGRIFPQLAGEQFEEAAAELGFRDFPKRWRMMREARNAFIHDSPFSGPRETLDHGLAHTAMQLLDQSYRLFVLINNRFVVDGRIHRGEPRHVARDDAPLEESPFEEPPLEAAEAEPA